MTTEIARLNRGKAYFHYLKPVISSLNEMSVAYAIVKGEPLSMLAYNGLAKRDYGDVDILVSRENISLVEEILKQNKFFPKKEARINRIVSLSGSHQTVPYRLYKGDFHFEVDLNFDIFWGEYTGKRIDVAKFLADTIKMDIYGCDVKTLKPVKAFIQLVLHHYKEMNSIFILSRRNCINLNMFNDVYFLWKNNQAVFAKELLFQCVEYGIIPYVYYILYFTNLIFNDSDLKELVLSFETLDGKNLLDCYGLSNKERKQWKYDFATRLQADNLFELISADLTEADIQKIERGDKIFN